MFIESTPSMANWNGTARRPRRVGVNSKLPRLYVHRSLVRGVRGGDEVAYRQPSSDGTVVESQLFL